MMPVLGVFAARRNILVVLTALLTASIRHPARAQSFYGHHEQYRYRALYVENPPTVDGELSDAVWQEAPLFEPLIQQFSAFSQPITEKTEVWLVYDAAALYIAAYCYDCRRLSPMEQLGG